MTSSTSIKSGRRILPYVAPPPPVRVTNAVIPWSGRRNWQTGALDNNLLRGLNSTATTRAWPEHITWFDKGNNFYLVIDPAHQAVLKRLQLYDGVGDAGSRTPPKFYAYDLDSRQEVYLGDFPGTSYNTLLQLPTAGAVSIRFAYIRMWVDDTSVLLPDYIRFFGDYTTLPVAIPYVRPKLLGFPVGGIVYPGQEQNSGPGTVEASRVLDASGNPTSVVLAEDQEGAMTFTRQYGPRLDFLRRQDKRELSTGNYVYDPPVLRGGICYGQAGYNLFSALRYAKAQGRPKEFNFIDNFDENLDSWAGAPLPPGTASDISAADAATKRAQMAKDAATAYGADKMDGATWLRAMQFAGQIRGGLGPRAVASSLLKWATTPFEWYHDNSLNVVPNGANLISGYFDLNEFNKTYLGRAVHLSAAEYGLRASCVWDCHKGKYASSTELRGWQDPLAPASTYMVMAPLDHMDAGWLRAFDDWCKKNRGYRSDGYADWPIHTVGINDYPRAADDSRGVPWTLCATRDEYLNVVRTTQELQPNITRFDTWEYGYSRNPNPDTVGNPTAAFSLVKPTAGRTVDQRQGDMCVHFTVMMWRIGWRPTFYQKGKQSNPQTDKWDHWCDPSTQCDAYMRQQLAVMNNATWLQTLSNTTYDKTIPYVDLGLRTDGKLVYTLLMGDETDRLGSYTVTLPYGGTLLRHADSGATCTETVLPAGASTIEVRELVCYVVANAAPVVVTPVGPSPILRVQATYASPPAATAAFTVAKYNAKYTSLLHLDDAIADAFTVAPGIVNKYSYDDGTGQASIKPRLSLAIFGVTGNGTELLSSGSGSLTWAQLKTLVNTYGWCGSNHSETHQNAANDAAALASVQALQTRFFNNMGFYPRTFIIPTNYGIYVKQMFDVGLLGGSSQSTSGIYNFYDQYSDYKPVPFANLPAWGTRYVLKRDNLDTLTTSNLSTYTGRVDTLLASTTPSLMNAFCHGIGVPAAWEQLIAYTVNTKPGIWMPSLQELFEWLEMKALSTFSQSVSGNVLTVIIDQSALPTAARHRDVSLLLPTGFTSLQVTGGLGYTSKAATGLVNLYNTTGLVPSGVSVPTAADSSGSSTTTTTYAARTTAALPASDAFVYETSSSSSPTISIRESTGYGANGVAVLIENRRFRNDQGWVADIYMPNNQAVTFRGCVFAGQSAADLVHITDNSNVTLENCYFIADGMQTVGTARARAIYAYRPRNVKVINCTFINTAGAKIEYWSDYATSTETISWLRNRYVNICGGTGGDYRQALQVQHVNSRPNIEIAYNQVINTPGQSRVEDNFNFGECSGTAASPLRLHHNYIRGAYPANPTDSGFTGTGWTTDSSGTGVAAALQPSYVLAEYNWAVACMNACANIAAGHHVTYRYNTLVVCGKLADGTKLNGVNNAVAIFKGQGYSDEQFDYNAITGNTIKYNAANGENPYYVNSNVGPNSQALTAGNTLNTYQDGATYADEEATFAAWQQYLTQQQVLIGAAF